NRTGGFLASNIGRRRAALIGKDTFDGTTDSLGGNAHFTRAGSDQFVKRVGLGGLVRSDRIVRIGRLATRGTGAQAHRKGAGGSKAQAGTDQLAAVHGKLPSAWRLPDVPGEKYTVTAFCGRL